MPKVSARGYALGVLFALNLVNFLDRNIIGAVAEPLRKEWGLSDSALGMLGTAFTLLYAILGVPLGRLADTRTRTWILAVGGLVWSVLTAASGLARNFGELFAARLGVGVGEAVCSPAATALIGDLYPANQRSRALSVFMLGLPLGLGLGYAIGGWAAQSYGWRASFYIAGIPGVVFALAALLIHEPARGAAETHSVGATRRGESAFRTVLSIPTIWWIIGGGVVHTFIFYALGSFLAAFLMRYHGLNLRQAGLVSMVVYGLSGIPALLLAGAAADSLSRGRPRARLLFGCGFVSLSVPLTLIALARPAGDVAGFGLLMGCGCAVLYGYYSAVYPTIHDIVEPSLRATAMAVYFCCMYVLGASLGPFGTGAASDYFAREAARSAGAGAASRVALEPFRAQGLHSAMYLVPVLCFLIAVFLFGASTTVRRDAERLQDWMRASAAKAVR